MKLLTNLSVATRQLFVKGRYILENVVVAHEILHSVHHAKCLGAVLKLDYKKAYDRVNWFFLLEILEKRGFGHTWISRIRKILVGGSVGVHINNCNGDFLTTGKGLR